MTAVRAATLVGRDEELQQVHAAVDAARHMDCTVLLIEGEAGIGKSRLVSDAVTQYVSAGDIVVRSQAVELAGGDVPYGVVADMLRDLRRRQVKVGAKLDPAVRSSLEDLLTTLTGGETPRLDRGVLLDAFVALVEALGHGRLVWWIVEDLHWADASSRDVLGYLIRTIGPSQLLVTMTVRTGEAWPRALAEFVAETIRSPRVRRMHLGPLTRAEVGSHVRQLTDRPVAAPVLERVRRLGEGNPFWTEELMLGGIGARGPVPETVRGLIEARLLRLGEESRVVVEAVSVVDVADHAPLSGVCGLDEDTLDRACTEAVRHQVLLVSDEGDGYRFRHALLREAVAHSLLPGRRMRLHRAWAEELDRLAVNGHGAQQRIAAAHHWARAGDPEKALTATYSAARLAEQASGAHEQAALLLRVLENWDAVAKSEQLLGVTRGSLVVRCIRALFASTQYADCLELVDKELALVDDDEVAELALRLRRRVALEELARDDGEDALEGLDEAVDMLLASPLDNPWLAPALLMTAYYLSDDQADVAIRLSERAVDAARAGDDLVSEMQAVDAVAWNRANLGQYDEAVRVLDAGVRRARSGEPSWASMLEGSMSWYLWSQGRHQEAVDAARSAMRYVPRPQAAGDRLAWLAESLAEALISMGEWDEAADLLDSVVASSLSGQAAVALHSLTGLLAVRRGDRATARTQLEVARRHTPPHEDALLSQRIPPRWLAAELAGTEHDLRAVREELTPLWEATHPEVVSESLWRPMLLLARMEADEASLPLPARVDWDAEAAAGSWRALEVVADRLHRLGPVSDAWRSQLAAERSRAEGTDAVQTWRDVGAQWAALGQPHELGYALLREAHADVRVEDRDAARSALTEAAAIAERLGARPLSAEIETLARRSRLNVATVVPRQRANGDTVFKALTPRETEVLALVARGLDNAGIAAELFISSKTASVHVSNILAKLGASSRTHAASLALRHGLADDVPGPGTSG